MSGSECEPLDLARAKRELWKSDRDFLDGVDLCHPFSVPATSNSVPVVPHFAALRAPPLATFSRTFGAIVSTIERLAHSKLQRNPSPLHPVIMLPARISAFR